MRTQRPESIVPGFAGPPRLSARALCPRMMVRELATEERHALRYSILQAAYRAEVSVMLLCTHKTGQDIHSLPADEVPGICSDMSTPFRVQAPQQAASREDRQLRRRLAHPTRPALLTAPALRTAALHPTALNTLAVFVRPYLIALPFILTFRQDLAQTVQLGL
jgi:hypothetical protein